MALYRSRDQRIFGGVCGGIAEWLGWGAFKVRVLYLILGALPAFAGIPIYIVLWLLVPQEPAHRAVSHGSRTAA